MIPLEVVLGGLRRRKRRSLLTILGLAIGAAAVVALVSLGQGLNNAIREEFSKVGADKLFIQPKGSFTGVGQSDSARITTTDLTAIRRVRGITQAAGHLTNPTSIAFKDQETAVVVGSIPSEEGDLVIEAHTFTIVQGRWFTKKEDDKIVIGNDFARTQVFSRALVIGDKIRIGNHTFEVAGVLSQIGAPNSDNGIFMTDRAFRETFGMPDDALSVIIARISRDADAASVEEAISHALRREHHVDKGKEDFEVQSPTDILATFSNVFLVVQGVLAGIAAVSLLVGGVGIANTMFMSVLDRTREIGVLKAIGATTYTVFALFAFESAVLGAAGGIVGTGLGILVAKIVERLAQIFVGSPLLQSTSPGWLMLGMIAFATLTGLIAGATPAYRAASLPPVEALRR